jgi:hypothetical protein
MACGQDDGNGYHNGYDELEGDWAVFYKIARYFVYKVKKEDRADFLHDLLLKMAEVKAKYEAQGKLLREAGLMWVGRYEVRKYWEKQRLRARVIVVSLNRQLRPDDGQTEFGEMLADNRVLDLDALVDAERFLESYPWSIAQIVYKRYNGLSVSDTERARFSYHRRKLQGELPPKKKNRHLGKLRIPTEEAERIRQAYFSEEKPIKQIARELRHDSRTVRKAINSVPGPTSRR